MTGASCGSADVFATAWVFCGSCLAAGGSVDGVSAGNRPAALPPGLSTVLAVAVKRTEVTVVAEAATAIFACSWRWADFASSAPRSHDVLPSWLPQPKLNVGFKLAGAAVRRMVASGTSPPCAQAVTVHRAVCPRWMLDLAGCTATHRLTCPG